MNKTLILALTIVFATFGCTEEDTAASGMADEVVTSDAASETDTASKIDETVISSTTSDADVSDAMIHSSFQAIDTNQDGIINMTEAEADTELLGAFIELDLDKTGDLNEVEYNKFVMVTK